MKSGVPNEQVQAFHHPVRGSVPVGTGLSLLGNALAPLAVNARITFIPVKPARNKSARTLEITKSFTFPASPLPWSFQGGARAKRIGSAVVDTNGDLIPDALLPGASNFVAGRSPDRSSANKLSEYGDCPCWEQTCHIDPSTGKEHCYTPHFLPIVR
jgi:hypothetical protein